MKEAPQPHEAASQQRAILWPQSACCLVAPPRGRIWICESISTKWKLNSSAVFNALYVVNTSGVDRWVSGWKIECCAL